MKITVRKNKSMQKNQVKSFVRSNKIFIVFIAAFVMAALIFGIVFGVLAAVRRGAAIAEFSGVTIDKPTASYFTSFYKYYPKQIFTIC